LSKYYGADIGSSTAYVVNVNTDFQLVQGVVVFVVPANSSGASPTLNVNGTGAIGLVNRANAAITANQIVANTMFAVMYDGVKYRIFTPIP
jgi:hypothetical protein